uniref:Uncharacterized protein n=1 Tax=Oryzias sinensis TaxID=183150 RepID=A0A8C7WVA7_9TELE
MKASLKAGLNTFPLQSSTQEIGEETEEDAVFTITLRKVQLHQSASKGQRWLGPLWLSSMLSPTVLSPPV